MEIFKSGIWYIDLYLEYKSEINQEPTIYKGN